MGDKYKNITVSGFPGAGSTTLMRLLENKLGWKGYPGGEFMRVYAMEKGYFNKGEKMHHDATVYPDDFDRQVDYGVREKLIRTNIEFETEGIQELFRKKYNM